MMTEHGGPGARDQDDTLRAADADREATAERLRRHHTAGRLTDDEFQDRLERAMAATTLAQLRALLADLPGERHALGARGPRARWFWPSLLPIFLLVALAVHSLGWAWHGGGMHRHWFPWPLLPLTVAAILIARRWRCAARRDARPV